MNRQVLRVLLMIVAHCAVVNLNARPHIRESDNPEKRKYILELAGQVSQDNGKQLLERYSAWELGTLLQDMQKLALREHAYAAERQAQATDSGNRAQINDTKKFFERAFLRNLPTEALSSKVDRIIFNPAWDPQLPKEINDQLAATHAGETQAISNQLCDIFAQSAGQAFTEEEQQLLRNALQAKIDQMLYDRDHQKSEVENQQPILDNAAHIQALDTAIQRVKELRHKRWVKIFKQFCCICIAVGLYRYRKQIAHYLLTHNFIPKALIRARV